MRPLIKVLRGLSPTAQYLLHASLYTMRHGSLPRSLRDKYLMQWAHKTLRNVKLSYCACGEAPSREPVIFVGNHVSYLDVPLICSQTPAVFVAKEEISHWPVIGKLCSLVDLVWVKRDSLSSRRAAMQKIMRKVLEDGERVALFPSGTTGIEERPWSTAVFRFAKQHGVPIQPFHVRYSPLEEAAYIGEDPLVLQALRLFKNKVHAEIEFGPITKIEDLTRDFEKIRDFSCRSPRLNVSFRKILHG